jgi:hypothetical protein
MNRIQYCIKNYLNFFFVAKQSKKGIVYLFFSFGLCYVNPGCLTCCSLTVVFSMKLSSLLSWTWSFDITMNSFLTL